VVCGSRSEREGEWTRPTRDQGCSRDRCGDLKDVKDRWKEEEGGRYLCLEKAARGCACAPCPIGGTPNLAGPTPESK